MDSLRKSLNKFKWDSIIVAVLAIVVGVLCIVFPESSGDVLCIVAGVALLVTGATLFVKYLAYGGLLFGGYVLITVLTTMTLGVFCLVQPGIIKNVLTLLFGVFIVIDSANAMAESVACSRVGMPGWFCMFVLSFLTTVLGVLVMFSWTFESVMTFAGISLIIEGVRNFVTTVVFAGKVRKARKELKGTMLGTYLGNGSEED